MTCPSYTLESDRELTKQTAIVLSIDSRPAYDHLHGQVMTIKDKRLAIEMLLIETRHWERKCAGKMASYRSDASRWTDKVRCTYDAASESVTRRQSDTTRE